MIFKGVRDGKPYRMGKRLGNLMIKADEGTKSKLQSLLDKARQLGVDDKVS